MTLTIEGKEMTRDLTKAQFVKQLDKYGMTVMHFGYVDIGEGIEVYRWNGGEKRREQLAYLLEQQRRLVK